MKLIIYEFVIFNHKIFAFAMHLVLYFNLNVTRCGGYAAESALRGRNVYLPCGCVYVKGFI